MVWWPNIRTFERAEIRIARADGMLLRASRSDARDMADEIGLTGFSPGTDVLVISVAARRTASRIVTTEELPGGETISLT